MANYKSELIERLAEQSKQNKKANLNMTKVTHFTNAQNLSSIYADGLLKLEGSNIEHIVRNNIPATHPSGMPINLLWKTLKMQYKYAGRYVWLTEENDVKCITAQREFNKKAFVFDADEIGAERWLDVAKRLAMRSKKAGKIIKALNDSARANGDDVSKWWVVKNDVNIKYCKNLSTQKLATAEQLAA